MATPHPGAESVAPLALRAGGLLVEDQAGLDREVAEPVADAVDGGFGRGALAACRIDEIGRVGETRVDEIRHADPDEPVAGSVRLAVETPEGAYDLNARYVVAADGARGAVIRARRR